MTLQVWKFPLRPDEVVIMPIGAKPLHVGEQFGSLVLWALCDDQADQEPRLFEIVGTGHPLPDYPLDFIGTALLMGGTLVLHVFERSEIT